MFTSGLITILVPNNFHVVRSDMSPHIDEVDGGL